MLRRDGGERAGAAVLNVTNRAGRVPGYIGLVERVLGVTGDARGIHAGKILGMRRGEFSEGEAGFGGGDGIGRERGERGVHALVAGDATLAGFFGGEIGLAGGEAGEFQTGVGVGKGGGVDEGFAEAAAETDEQQGDAGDDKGAGDQTAARAKAADGFALGDGFAAGAVGEGAVRAGAAPVLGTRAFPGALGFTGGCDELGFALGGGATFAGRARADAARAAVAGVAADPVFIGTFVASAVEVGGGCAALAHLAPPENA